MTTHKTLRGPRGGMMMCKRRSTRRRSISAVFPGLQGGPHNHTTAAIAVALKEAATAEFKEYARADRRATPRRWPTALIERGFTLITGGTDNHLILDRPDQQEHPGQGRRQGARRAPASSSTTTRSRSTRASRSIRRASAWGRRR